MEDVSLPVRCDDDTLDGTNLDKFSRSMLQGSINLGVPMDTAVMTKKVMEEVGFVDVVEVVYKWPINLWPADKKMKEIGMWPSIPDRIDMANLLKCILRDVDLC